MLAAAREKAGTPKGKRDLALVRLMHDLGLRRGEVVALDLADVDAEAGTVAVVGKGKSEKVNLTLNAPTAAALADWVAARGDWPGALFVRLDRAAGPGPPGRLDAGNVARVSHGLGRRAGVAARHQSARAAAPGDHPGARPGPRGRPEGEAVQPSRQDGDPAEVRRQPPRRGRGHREDAGRGFGLIPW